MTKYTPDQIDRACELREQGVGIPDIARMLGMSKSAIEYHLLRNGADTPRPQRFIGFRTCLRGGRLVRAFGPQEDQILISMSNAGARYADIARTVNRSLGSVRMRLLILARHEARAEARELAA